MVVKGANQYYTPSILSGTHIYLDESLVYSPELFGNIQK